MKKKRQFLAFIDTGGKIIEYHEITGVRLAPQYVSKTGVTVLPSLTFGKGSFGVAAKNLKRRGKKK